MVDVGNFAASKSLIKSYSDFVAELKTKLNWNKSQWELSGEKGSRINKLTNSMHYWKTKLKPAFEDTSIVFTIFNEERDVKTDVGHVIELIENLDSSIKVKGFSTFRNPRYLCIYMDNKENRDKTVEMFKMAENGFIVHLDWAFNTGAYSDTLKVHWLPMTFSIDLIKKELEKYAKFIKHEREELKLMSGREVPSGKVTFNIALKQGITAESVPHTVIIGNMEALITIPGRLPMCLNCSALGHISKNCKLRFCQKCNKMQKKDHICEDSKVSVSYAAVVMNNSSVKEIIDQEDLEAAFEQRQDGFFEKENSLLSKKIVELEKQMLFTKSESGDILEIKRDNKRKADNIGRPNNFFKEDPSQELQSESSEDQIDFENDGSDASDEIKTVQEQLLEPMSTESFWMPNTQQVQPDSKRKRNRSKAKGEKIIGRGSKSLSLSAAKDTVNAEEMVRSYGKPNYANSRRSNEERAFDKACQKSPEHREFIFKD